MRSLCFRSMKFATKSREETKQWVRIIEDHLQRLRYDEIENESSSTAEAKVYWRAIWSKYM